jgi:hypothetical protein
MSAWRARPPATLQGALTCWAAAISSFARMTRDVPNWSTAGEVVTYFKSEFSSELNADGSLKTPSGWIAFAKKFDLNIAEIRLNDPMSGALAATAGITSTVANDLKSSHFIPKLHSSHIITVVGTRSDNELSHTHVIYGADNLRLCYMNPLFDPARPLASPRPPGGSGRVAQNWFCDTHDDFATGPKYLLIWRS